MRIEKAIETNTELVGWLKRVNWLKREKALQLGIEAMKFRLRWEQQEGEDDFLLLPGETKD